MTLFSQYSDLFGKAKMGFHQTRFLDAAAFDYFGSLIVAMITTYFSKIPLVLTTIGIFVIGLILHYLFGVQTASLKYLGLL